MKGKSLIGIVAGLTMLGNVAMGQTNTNYTSNNANKTKTEQSYKVHNPYEGTVISVKEKTMTAKDESNVYDIKYIPVSYELIKVQTKTGIKTVFTTLDTDYQPGEKFDMFCEPHRRKFTYNDIAKMVEVPSSDTYLSASQNGDKPIKIDAIAVDYRESN